MPFDFDLVEIVALPETVLYDCQVETKIRDFS